MARPQGPPYGHLRYHVHLRNIRGPGTPLAKYLWTPGIPCPSQGHPGMARAQEPPWQSIYGHPGYSVHLRNIPRWARPRDLPRSIYGHPGYCVHLGTSQDGQGPGPPSKVSTDTMSIPGTSQEHPGMARAQEPPRKGHLGYCVHLRNMHPWGWGTNYFLQLQ